jgi:hypothetical protein
MEPPNLDGGLGRYRPSMVVVALGDPGRPVVCCAIAGAEPRRAAATTIAPIIFVVMALFPFCR